MKPEDFEELERRILKKFNLNYENLPEEVLVPPEEWRYSIIYCIVHALCEYDKMREEKLNQTDGEARTSSPNY